MRVGLRLTWLCLRKRGNLDTEADVQGNCRVKTAVLPQAKEHLENLLEKGKEVNGCWADVLEIPKTTPQGQ